MSQSKELEIDQELNGKIKPKGENTIIKNSDNFSDLGDREAPDFPNSVHRTTILYVR